MTLQWPIWIANDGEQIMAVVEELVLSEAEGMKRVAEEIVSSYQSRISTVAVIIDNTHQILEDFKNQKK